jgi:hypothetical protein
MTEAEWLTSEDPIAMNRVVSAGVLNARWPDGSSAERKQFLFSLACCRLVWPLVEVDDRTRKLVEHYERHVDWPPHDVEIDHLWYGVKEAARHPEEEASHEQMVVANMVYDLSDTGSVVAWLTSAINNWGDVKQRTCDIADLLRCVFGNPFRPIAFDPNWRTETVVALASAIYAERAFDRLPILADALEEAGCDHADILSHCRGPGPHARGCWVVDGILGKE